jgi:Flp pilus assembly protein TadG
MRRIDFSDAVSSGAARPPSDAIRSCETGAVAIEFALVLSLFLLLLYGTIHYGLLLSVRLSFVAAASDAARAAVSADPEDPDYADLVAARARAVVAARLAWMSDDLRSTVLGESGENVEVTLAEEPELGTVVEVVVRYAAYDETPLVPALRLPLLGAVPPLPSEISATARAPL